MVSEPCFQKQNLLSFPFKTSQGVSIQLIGHGMWPHLGSRLVGGETKFQVIKAKLWKQSDAKPGV